MSHTEFCVYTANNVEEADIVAAWLAEQDIEAMIPDRYAIGATTWGLPAIVPGGIEVCVKDAETADLAQALLEQQAETIHSHLHSDESDDEISLICDNCHETILFSPDDAGTVAQCPNCREYVDVPGFDEA